jgi:predicted PurR-regulated permease PerM
MVDPRYDLARITLSVLFLAILIGASLWILRPFLPAVVWAATLVIATWPVMRRVQDRLWHSRGLAVAVMTVVLLLVFVVPLWLAVSTIVTNSGQILQWGEALTSAGLPPPPAWLGSLPLVGPPAVNVWEQVGDVGLHDLLLKIRPYIGSASRWFIAAVGGFGAILVQFLLTVAVAAIMYAKGEQAAAATLRFGTRLAGARGEQSVRLAGQAIRGVALAVVATALVQTAIGGVGLLLAGVPFASILCALMFMLCIAQLGPALVLIPAVVYMFATGGDLAWSIVLLVCSLVAMTIDNVLRPLLIRRGADLPILLILAGVIGGLLGFGLIGLFLGPTILAVSYRLLEAWVNEAGAGEGGATAAPP